MEKEVTDWIQSKLDLLGEAANFVTLMTVRRAMCMRDEGSPLAAGRQWQAANHLKLRWLRAIRGERCRKRHGSTVSGRSRKDERK